MTTGPRTYRKEIQNGLKPTINFLDVSQLFWRFFLLQGQVQGSPSRSWHGSHRNLETQRGRLRLATQRSFCSACKPRPGVSAPESCQRRTASEGAQRSDARGRWRTPPANFAYVTIASLDEVGLKSAHEVFVTSGKKDATHEQRRLPQVWGEGCTAPISSWLPEAAWFSTQDRWYQVNVAIVPPLWYDTGMQKMDLPAILMSRPGTGPTHHPVLPRYGSPQNPHTWPIASQRASVLHHLSDRLRL